MVEKFNPTPLDKHPEDPTLILEVTIFDHGRPYGWEWQVSDRGDVIMTGFEDSVSRPSTKAIAPCSVYSLQAGNRLTSSIPNVDSLMGQNPDRAPTRQKHP